MYVYSSEEKSNEVSENMEVIILSMICFSTNYKL
jgi:hypothetical protein